MKLEWKMLCPKCKKRYVKSMLPKVRRHQRENPKTRLRRIARFYGIPHSTLHDAMNRKVKHE